MITEVTLMESEMDQELTVMPPLTKQVPEVKDQEVLMEEIKFIHNII